MPHKSKQTNKDRLPKFIFLPMTGNFARDFSETKPICLLLGLLMAGIKKCRAVGVRLTNDEAGSRNDKNWVF